MKKCLCFLMVLLSIMTTALVSCGQKASQGLEFESNGDGTCCVFRVGECTDVDVVIPERSPKGDLVTSIGMSAFSGCDDILSIVIPDSVISIEDHAFAGCRNLTSMTIPNSVTSIGRSAFRDCTGLTSVTIPDSVTSIGAQIFDRCTGLTSITIPAGVTSIGSSVFRDCTALTSINVSEENSVYHSKDNCLIETDTKTLVAGCKASVIPDYVTGIGDNAFSCCRNLTSITIPKGVTRIAGNPFSNCSGLTSITVDPKNSVYYSQGNCVINTLDNMLIIGCGSSVIPDSVEGIGTYAFSGCDSLTNLTIPNNVMSIGEYAFVGCNDLTSITIPDSVTRIDLGAFAGCTELKDIYFTGTEEEWATIEIGYFRNDILSSTTIHYNYVPEE